MADREVLNRPEACGSNVAIESLTNCSRSPRNLPDDLVVKIIARIPFPAILKARCLSKGWRSRLSLGVEEWQKEFQHEVTLVSRKWPDFTPIFIKGGAVVGYNEVTQSWRMMKMHPSTTSDSFADRLFLDYQDSRYIRDRGPTSIHLGGALICYIKRVNHHYRTFVANLLTGSFKVVPSSQSPEFAHSEEFEQEEAKIFHVASDGYRILLIFFGTDYSLHSKMIWSLIIQDFDSKSNTWSNASLPYSIIDPEQKGVNFVTCSPCVDDSIYLLFSRREASVEDEEDDMEGAVYFNRLLLCRYNLNTNKFSILLELHDHFYDELGEVAFRILLCGSRIMLVSTIDCEHVEPHVHKLLTRVSELNVERTELVHVSDSPKIDFHTPQFANTLRKSIRDITRLCSDGSHLYIAFVLGGLREICCYDLLDDKWTGLQSPPPPLDRICNAGTWVNSPFSPGLQPFFSP